MSILIPPPHTDLWARIASYAFDEGGDLVCFDEKLCRENGWTRAFALRAMEEYRRYAFLAIASGHYVSPSDVVDQVWHLHLMYTHRYWDEFCAKVLQRPLHHDPSTGRDNESAGLKDAYAQTLESYQKFFGVAPPQDIWPARASPGPRVHQRVDLRHCVIVPRPLAIAIGVGFAVLFIVALLLLFRG